MIHMVAEHDHYLDHMIGIWNALPDYVKGKTFLKQDRVVIPREDIVLVAGYSDVKRMQRNRVIYVEHGAGQTYVGMDLTVQPFYSGGPQHRNVIGYICPNNEVAGRWNVRYPNKPTAVVGCPRLDPWHIGNRGQHDPRTVAFTFHWDAQFTGVPETASAFPYYLPDLVGVITSLRREGWTVLGHGHPRYRALHEYWVSPDMKDLGVVYVESSDGILDRAAVLVADNTSLQAEFLSLGRPVVWLNHPQYRRDVWQGGRFWQWPTLGGVQVDSGSELRSLDLANLPPVTGHPYAYADGHASQRAADAILKFLSTENT